MVIPCRGRLWSAGRVPRGTVCGYSKCLHPGQTWNRTDLQWEGRGKHCSLSSEPCLKTSQGRNCFYPHTCLLSHEGEMWPMTFSCSDQHVQFFWMFWRQQGCFCYKTLKMQHIYFILLTRVTWVWWLCFLWCELQTSACTSMAAESSGYSGHSGNNWQTGHPRQRGLVSVREYQQLQGKQCRETK